MSCQTNAWGQRGTYHIGCPSQVKLLHLGHPLPPGRVEAPHKVWHEPQVQKLQQHHSTEVHGVHVQGKAAVRKIQAVQRRQTSAVKHAGQELAATDGQVAVEGHARQVNPCGTLSDIVTGDVLPQGRACWLS